MQLTLVRQPSPVAVPAAPVVVRPMVEADLDRVGRLYAVSYPDGVAGTVEEAIADVRASWDGDYGRWLHDACLVAEVDGRPVGAILTVEHPPWPDVEDLVFIIDLFTDPARRREGIGAALVGTALAAVGDRQVGLRVDSAHEPAVALYRRLGFEDR